MATPPTCRTLSHMGFQSTPPIRVATIPSTFADHSIYFNPRHPYGWRRTQCVPMQAFFYISIHATHTGGDQNCISENLPDVLFQSTPPIRVATLMDRCAAALEEFQSTPPIRVATYKISTIRLRQSFQSTPPIRVATSVDGISVQVS